MDEMRSVRIAQSKEQLSKVKNMKGAFIKRKKTVAVIV